MRFISQPDHRRAATLLPLLFTLACNGVSTMATPREEAKTDDAQSDADEISGPASSDDFPYRLGLGANPSVSQLEVARIGAQPVSFETHNLAGTETMLDLQPGGAEWLTATAVNTSGEVVLTEVLSGSCSPPSEGRAWLVPSEVDTIQAAIDEASPGDTVLVEPGTYYEHLELNDGIRLVGSGADRTILDGGGEPRNLIELIGGRNVLVRGFTMRGVEQADGCASSDPTQCSGNWYASALYVAPVEEDMPACGPPSIIVVHNIFEENDIGMMAYFQPYVVVRNNIFQNNRVGFVANHHGSGKGLVSQNVFFQNQEQGLALSASYIDVLNNIFAQNGIACEHEYVQRGRASCNVFYDNSTQGTVGVGVDGNVEINPMFASPQSGDFSLLSTSPAIAAGCAAESTSPPGVGGAVGSEEETIEINPVEPGIYGGIFGHWGIGE